MINAFARLKAGFRSCFSELRLQARLLVINAFARLKAGSQWCFWSALL
jgi:hypothetical protein